MDERSEVFSTLAEEILERGAYKATMYLNDKLTVKATRKRYKGKILKGHAVEIIFTIGKPNYEERAKIQRAREDGQTTIEMTAKYLKK